MTRAHRTYICKLDRDFRAYRSTVTRVFSRKLSVPRHCARYFFDVLVSTSQLYVDYLLSCELESTITTERTTHKRSRTQLPTRESRIREKMTERLGSLACWSVFHPRNEFAAENKLQTQTDYVARLVLHLPEIYSETTKLENCLRQALKEGGFTDYCLAELVVGLEHVGHHASYCRHALEILSQEDSWTL